MAAPTVQEKALLEQFRAKTASLNLSGTLAQDIFLIKWLRARDGDLEKATAMLTKHMAWRQKHDYDNILSWTPSAELVQGCPHKFLGYDDDNSPVIWLPFGKWLVKEAASRDKKEYIKYWHWLLATSAQKMEGKKTKANYPVTQFVGIYDMDEFSMTTLASVSVIDMLMKVTKQFERNHPETAKKFYMINTGSAFEKLFNMLKPLISPNTLEKVNVMAKPETWLPVLQADLPQNVLPVKYGGQNPIVS